MSSAILGKTSQVLSTICPFIVLAGIVILQSQEYKNLARQLNHADYLTQQEEQARLVNWQKQTSHLDFDNLQADWSYLDFVQYFGDVKARETIGYELVPEYFSAVTTIDPRFSGAYLNLAIANSMYAGYPEKSIALLEEVLKSVDPVSEEAAWLWTSKGLDELLFMGDKKAALKSYEMAAKLQSLDQAKFPPGLNIQDLALALEEADAKKIKQAQIRAWSSVLVHVKDQPRKQEIIAKISTLQSELAALSTLEETGVAE